MPYCRKCGKEILNNFKFCTNCGEKINPPAISILQPSEKMKAIISLVAIIILIIFVFWTIFVKNTLNSNTPSSNTIFNYTCPGSSGPTYCSPCPDGSSPLTYGFCYNGEFHCACPIK